MTEVRNQGRPLATVIRFSGSDDPLKVRQSAEEVSKALSDSNGRPFALTLLNNGDPVYINPATIACWHPMEDRVSPGRLMEGG
jgi:hypothetical protein